MLENDETTGKELVEHLRGAGIMVSESTALRIRKQLGWTSRGAAYCQLNRNVNFTAEQNTLE